MAKPFCPSMASLQSIQSTGTDAQNVFLATRFNDEGTTRGRNSGDRNSRINWWSAVPLCVIFLKLEEERPGPPHSISSVFGFLTPSAEYVRDFGSPVEQSLTPGRQFRAHIWEEIGAARHQRGDEEVSRDVSHVLHQKQLEANGRRIRKLPQGKSITRWKREGGGALAIGR